MTFKEEKKAAEPEEVEPKREAEGEEVELKEAEGETLSPAVGNAQATETKKEESDLPLRRYEDGNQRIRTTIVSPSAGSSSFIGWNSSRLHRQDRHAHD